MQDYKNKHASQKQKIQPDFQISEYQKHKKQSLNIKKKFHFTNREKLNVRKSTYSKNEI